MKLYNPKLSDSIIDLTDEQLNSRVTASSLTERERLTNSGYVPYTSNLNFSGNSSNNISQGSDDIRAAANATKNNASSLYSDITDEEANTTINDLRASLGLVDENAAFTDADQQRVEQAGAAEGAKYDPLITEAIETKRQGMPKSLVRGGEKGGLMSTQVAGAAALEQTVGNNWVGAGGELENIQSAYDRNITDLKTKKSQAIQLAKQKAEEAIRSGRKSANDQAIQLFELAQKANQQSLDLIAKRDEILMKREKNIQDKQKYNLDVLNNFATAGQPLTASTRSEIDAIYGEGFADRYYQTSLEKDATKKATDIIDLLNKIPIGKEIQIGENVYQGIKDDGETQIFSETDNAGNVMFITLNKKTGEVLNKASGGKVGKASKTGSGDGDGGGGSGLSAKFWAEVDSAKNELQQGEPWGTVFSRLKLQFPNAPAETIDQALGTQWREPGAYQAWVKAKKVDGADADVQALVEALKQG